MTHKKEELSNFSQELVPSVIQSVRQNFDTQCRSLGLKVNQQKTKTMIIYKKKNLPRLQIPTNNEIKLLGIIFNDKLNWSSHIDFVIKKASKQFFPLRKLKKIVSMQSLSKIYNATIRSHLEYAAPLFVGLSRKDSEKLEKVQRRALRTIYQSNDVPNIPSLASRRISQAQRLYKKAHKNKTHSINFLIPKRLTASRKFRQPPSRTSRRINSFVPYTTIQINNT